MLHKKRKYSILFILIATIGLLTSMIHFHGPDEEYLEHTEETHFLETEDYCTLCSYVIKSDFKTRLNFNAYIGPKALAQSTTFDFTEDSFAPKKNGRSPPSLV